MKFAKAITLILTLLPILAAAQSGNSDGIAVTVPFDFVVGAKLIPAGHYIVQRAENMTVSLLTLRNTASSVNVFSPTVVRSQVADGRSALVFHRYGDRYFLAEARTVSGTIYNMREGKLERELRAQNSPLHEEILVASRH